MTAISPDVDREQWLAARRLGIGASEIAAVMGISPWESPFSLHWRKVNGWEVEANDDMRDGLLLEDAIAEWWSLEHDPNGNLAVRTCGLMAHPERAWQIATPDRLIYLDECTCDAVLDPDVLCYCDPSDHGRPLAVLELKYVKRHSWDGWGDPGSDQVPVHYRAQVLWQCDVVGVDQWYLAALGPGGFREYRGLTNEPELALMREAGQAFMDRLESGEAPDIDSHSATLATLKRLHPNLTNEEVEVGDSLAANYKLAVEMVRSAQASKDAMEIQLRAAMGSARCAVHNGHKVATRVITDIAESTRTVAAHRRDYLLAPREAKS